MPADMMQSWRSHHPLWTYMLWTESSLQEHFPNGLQNQNQFDEMSEWNGKCDIARYEILCKFGGFFVDADSVCLRALDDYLLSNDSFSCYENELERRSLVAAGYLGCTKSNQLMKHLIQEISVLKGRTLHPVDNSAWKTVGPGLLTMVIHKYKYQNIAIYPSFYFIPVHYTNLKPYTGPFEPYADQYWGSCPQSDKFNYE